MSQQCERVKANGDRCKRQAVDGGTLCGGRGSHGNAPQVRRKAAARAAESKAMAALDREGIVPVSNPLEALQQLAGEVVRVKDFLGKRVEVLDELRYRGIGGEQVRGELQAYGAALDRSIRVLEAIAKLNIDERLERINAKLARDYAELMTWAGDWVFEQLTGVKPWHERSPRTATVPDLLMEWFLVQWDIAPEQPSGARFTRIVVPPLEPALQQQVDDFRHRWEVAETAALRVTELEVKLAAEVQRRVDAEIELGILRSESHGLPQRRPLALEGGGSS